MNLQRGKKYYRANGRKRYVSISLMENLKKIPSMRNGLMHLSAHLVALKILRSITIHCVSSVQGYKYLYTGGYTRFWYR